MSQSKFNNTRLSRVNSYWKTRRNFLKVCESSVVTDAYLNDPRPYAKIKIAGRDMMGLLDSGATVSILGKNSIEFLSSCKISYNKQRGFVTTADGTLNEIFGCVHLEVEFASKIKTIKFCIVPSLDGKLFLGVDFWVAFGLAPCFVNSVSISNIDSNKHVLNAAQNEQLEQIKKKFPSAELLGLGKTNLLEHEIDVGDAKPIKQRYYRISPAIQKDLDSVIERMLSMGVIEESNSAWCSPVVLVKKPNGQPRLCLDSRKLNSVTKKDAYPLPVIDGLLSRLHDTKYISCIDLKDAFWQIPLSLDAREKTAFTVEGRPLYHFKVMPFGLCNAAQTLCRLMHRVIPHELHDRVFVYLDDLLIISGTLEAHFQLLERVAKLLDSAGLTINVDKSKFVLRESKYLGFIVGEDGLRTDPAKVEAIRNFPQPKTVKQARRLLGMAGWYRRFIPNYSDIAAPIFNLLKKGVKFEWSSEAQNAFEILKDRLSSSPVLVNADYKKHFYIRCDASNDGVGSVLYQKDEDGAERPISYISQKLNDAQKKYTVTELECLAALIAIKKFRPYVEGLPFTVITDHASLKWLMTQKELSGRLARWSLKLQAMDFIIEHQRGSENVVPDALSRVFCDELDNLGLQQSMITSALDLASHYFNEPSYVSFKTKIVNDENNFPGFRVIDDRIFFRIDARKGDMLNDLPAWKAWIPEGMRSSLIKSEHDVPEGGHGGISKTLERLRRYYYWPKMAKEVHDYVNNCEICKACKAPNYCLRPPMGQQFKVERPFQRIFIDLMGPYPRSKKGKTVIFIVVDQLTKYVLLKALRTGSASSIVEFLREEVFNVYGVPENLQSDNGVQFVSKEFSSLMAEFGINHTRSAIYSPQSNASERVNRSILASIRSYVAGKHNEWDKYLCDIASSLRNSFHSTINCTPYFALFGYHKINHADTYRLLHELNSVGENWFDPIDLPDRLALVHQEIQRSLTEAYYKNCRTYNLRTRPTVFRPGQIVYVRQHFLSDASKKFSAKLAPKFKKAIISKKVGNVNYEIVDENGKFLGKFHAKDIKS